MDALTGHPVRLFTLRIWSEEVEGGVEQRGMVRDAASGAFRVFRSLADVPAFLADLLGASAPGDATHSLDQAGPGAPASPAEEGP
jgi:hypothetical protein